jgi:hypothetical protein
LLLSFLSFFFLFPSLSISQSPPCPHKAGNEGNAGNAGNAGNPHAWPGRMRCPSLHPITPILQNPHFSYK